MSDDNETKNKGGRPKGSKNQAPVECVEVNRVKSMRYALNILKSRLYEQQRSKDKITISNKDLMEIIRTLKDLKETGEVQEKEANSITQLARQLKASKKTI